MPNIPSNVSPTTSSFLKLPPNNSESSAAFNHCDAYIMYTYVSVAPAVAAAAGAAAEKLRFSRTTTLTGALNPDARH